MHRLGSMVRDGAFIFYYVRERMSRHECKKISKRDSGQAEVQRTAYVEAAVSVIDVGPVRCVADRFQVHSPLGMDDGVPGGETQDLPLTDLAASFCRV